ncbi:BREX-1 system adenine-specific DNA-methyltransferase PglX [Anaerolineales bacterium HSG25]|nr:BREX-1 system adenine-specific DNA-methyltransferase PglX [Anaerolineales bacterium HSG25]
MIITHYPMNVDHKKILRAVSLELRHILEGQYDERGQFQPGDLERRLNAIGIWRDRPAKPLHELSHLPPADQQAHEQVLAYVAFRQAAGVPRAAAIAEFGRESAYSWANRLLTLRCMEARALIDEIILQKEVYGGRSMVHQRFARRQPERCTEADDGLFAVLLAEFEQRVADLPRLFNPTSPAIALRPSVAALKACVALLSGTETARNQEPATDAVFAAPDALGWAYQYWNAEEKDRVFEKVRTQKGAKIEGADIIPATQLYTEPYMVKFLVQNSLGAIWMQWHPETKLVDEWDYFVKEADRETLNPAEVAEKRVRDLTLLDPACGSGHFLLEAFDLLYAMYEEEQAQGWGDPTEPLSPEQICLSILNHNLFGIDIDERAVQIATAALWMKATETAFELEPSQLTSFHDHVVATNIRLPQGTDHLQTFLSRHPEDAPLRPALETVFEGLTHAHELGSLLQIEEPVEKELRYLKNQAETAYRQPQQPEMFAEFATPRQTELPLSQTDYATWKNETLQRLKTHFEQESQTADPSRAFFGETAGQGLTLFDLLARRYDVVAANPPYMGSKNMVPRVKNYVAKNYPAGKRDLYAVFILRCLELTQHAGRVAMVTQQSWMFLRSFVDLRALDEKRVTEDEFKGILRETSIETLAQLGEYAFTESSAAGAFVCLFTLAKFFPKPNHKLIAYRLIGPKQPEKKAQLLQAHPESTIYRATQSNFVAIHESPLIYYLNKELLELFQFRNTLQTIAHVRQGLATADDSRFLRFTWEIDNFNRWATFTKGGGYCKWFGQNWYHVDWEYQGTRLKSFPRSVIRNPNFYFQHGWSYSLISRGATGLRAFDSVGCVGHKGPGIFSKETWLPSLLQSHFVSFLLRAISQTLAFEISTMASIPLPDTKPTFETTEHATSMKRILVSNELTERTFNRVVSGFEQYMVSSYLHTFEGFIEKEICSAYNLSENSLTITIAETGTPAGWHPLIKGYDSLPPLPNGLTLPPELLTYLEQHDRRHLTSAQLTSLQQQLHTLYQAGPGAKLSLPPWDTTASPDTEPASAGATLPIPTETFIEALSVTLQVHPISIYWLLQEGQDQHGWHCPPEEKRLTEDRLTVLILRLLGHRWPKQVQANEPPPSWAVADGIIPLTEGLPQQNLLAQLRNRLAATALSERAFAERVGQPLADWLTGSFFKRHISQFKKRPIAWQLQSSGRNPAFACLIYYHQLNADLLPKLRTQYVGPLRQRYETERRTLEQTLILTTDQSARKLQLSHWIEELKQFETSLHHVSEQGFGPEHKPLQRKLRQHAVDEAILSLKSAWLTRLAEVIRTETLNAWQTTAHKIWHSYIPTTASPTELNHWLADAVDRLPQLSPDISPSAPKQTTPDLPTPDVLAAHLHDHAESMVQQALQGFNEIWWANYKETILAPLKAKQSNKHQKKLLTLHINTGQAIRDHILGWSCPQVTEWGAWLAHMPLYDYLTSVDGKRPPPTTIADFIRQESAYHPDSNDGVRVNIAPLQQAGLLAAPVIAKKDLLKAITDRADWRADERRWSRQGKLPQPGWW